MKALIKSLFLNKEEIINKSILNCHTNGLHSIYLSGEHKLIRMFIAEPGCSLGIVPKESKPLYLTPTEIDFTIHPIAIHPHHCDIALVPVCGDLFNWEFSLQPTDFDKDIGTIGLWQYRSKISHGEIGFKKIGETGLSFVGGVRLSEGQLWSLSASSLHTVSVNPDQYTAWVVVEGNENKDYNSVAYSNLDLSQIDTTDLYQKMNVDKFYELMHEIGVF